MKVSQFAANHPYVFADTHLVRDWYDSEWLTIDEANKYAQRAQGAGLITSITGRRWEDDKYKISVYESNGKVFVRGEKFTGPVMTMEVSDTTIPWPEYAKSNDWVDNGQAWIKAGDNLDEAKSYGMSVVVYSSGSIIWTHAMESAELASETVNAVNAMPNHHVLRKFHYANASPGLSATVTMVPTTAPSLNKMAAGTGYKYTYFGAKPDFMSKDWQDRIARLDAYCTEFDAEQVVRYSRIWNGRR